MNLRGFVRAVVRALVDYFLKIINDNNPEIIHKIENNKAVQIGLLKNVRNEIFSKVFKAVRRPMRFLTSVRLLKSVKYSLRSK